MSQSSGADRQTTPVTHLAEKRRGAYATLKRVREFSTADGSARGALSIIATYADDEGYARPSVPTIARDLGASERTVTRAIKALEELGELDVLERGNGGRASRYRVTVWAPNPDTVSPNPIEHTDTLSPQPRHSDTPTLTPCHPKDQGKTIEGGGSTSRTCSRHAGMTDPPPCGACRTAREAADAAAFAASQRRAIESAAAGRLAAAQELAGRADPETRARRAAEVRAAKGSTDRARTGTLPQDEPKG